MVSTCLSQTTCHLVSNYVPSKSLTIQQNHEALHTNQHRLIPWPCLCPGKMTIHVNCSVWLCLHHCPSVTRESPGEACQPPFCVARGTDVQTPPTHPHPLPPSVPGCKGRAVDGPAWWLELLQSLVLFWAPVRMAAWCKGWNCMFK